MSMNSESADSIRQRRPAAAKAAVPAIEPWFTVLMSSLLPLVGALFVPTPWQFALHILGGTLCVVGLVLLVRHELAARRKRDVTDR